LAGGVNPSRSLLAADTNYLGSLQKLTDRVEHARGVGVIKSLTAGPKSFDDAIKSPFWSRLLIAPDRKSISPAPQVMARSSVQRSSRYGVCWLGILSALPLDFRWGF
jgi:hypothetical protein